MVKIKLKSVFGFSRENLCRIVIFFSFVSFGYAQETKVNKLVETQTGIAEAIDKIRTNEETPGAKAEQPLNETKVEEEKIKMPAAAEEVSLSEFMAKSDFSSDRKVDSAKTDTAADKKNADKSAKIKDDSEQENRTDWKIPRGSIEYGAEFGFAPNIATWLTGGKVWDISRHKHLATSVRWGRILGTNGNVTFSYAVEFIPLSLTIGNEVVNKNYTPGSATESPTKRETTYGFVISPANFRFIFFPKFRLRPFLGSALGPSYHFKNVPIPSGSKWNLMLDFQIGGQYMLSEKKAIQFGYRYFHLSNVYLSNYNPGYNVNMFFIGYSIFKK
ncbi:MAG: acyloxyacyl hydrolase [Acidobacteriota bacterium]|nr:acyloxyacyl hydrolase [Acidobacteriota bacterium]